MTQEILLLSLALAVPILTLGAFAGGLFLSRAWTRDAMNAECEALRDALKHERRVTTGFFNQVRDLEKLLSAKDLAGYMAIKTPEDLESRAFDDAQEFAIERERRGAEEATRGAQILFDRERQDRT